MPVAEAQRPVPLNSYHGQPFSKTWTAVKRAAYQKIKAHRRAYPSLEDADELVAVMKSFKHGLGPTLRKVEASKTQNDRQKHASRAIKISKAYYKAILRIENPAVEGDPYLLISGMLRIILKEMTRVNIKPDYAPVDFSDGVRFSNAWKTVKKNLQKQIKAALKKDRNDRDALELKKLPPLFKKGLSPMLTKCEAARTPEKRLELAIKAQKIVNLYRLQVKNYLQYDLKRSVLALEVLLKEMSVELGKAIHSKFEGARLA